MSRLTLKDYGTLVRYLCGARFPGGPPPSSADHDIANNTPLTASDAADTTSIHLLSADIDGMVRVDKSATLGARVPIPFHLPTAGALATQTIFTNPPSGRNVSVTAIMELHSTAETATGTATLTVTHETGTQAPGTGTAIMTNTINLKGTANTLQTGTLLGVTGPGDTNPALILAPGDRLSILVGGTATITALAGVTVTVWVDPGQKGAYAIYQQSGGTLATQGFFQANRDLVVQSGYLIYSAAGTDAGTVTVDVTHETGTTAPGAGTSILSAVINVKQAANTAYALPLTATASTLKLLAGDRLSIKFNGTLTSLAGVVLVVDTASVAPITNYQSQSHFLGSLEVCLAANAAALQTTQGIIIADRDYEVVDASAIWATASGGGGTLNYSVDKGVNAPGSGTGFITNLALSGTANTTNVGVLNVSRRTRMISQGDLVSAVFGSPASTAGSISSLTLLPR